MDFKVDQNLPEEVVQILRSDGHDARNVYEEQLDGRPDPEISAAVKRESRALITLDLDFADIRSYPPEQYSGLLVIRLHRQDKPAVIRATRSILPLLRKESLAGRLWIVTDANVRIHGQPEE
jgi:predicted nuclease of predicted toxin-antitoxin system